MLKSRVRPLSAFVGGVGELATAVLVGGLIAALASFGAIAGPARNDVTLPGLRYPVEIVLDRYGIPHIYADDDHDLFLAQGWAVARDRLWQLDLWHRAGLGHLAAVFGPRYAERDQAVRLFLYEGDMAREWAVDAPGARDAAEAFAAGVDAYIDAARADPALMPPEFAAIGYAPEAWTGADVVRIRTYGVDDDVTSEIKRARVACAAGVETDLLRQPLQPPHTPVMPPGLDPCTIPADVLRLYNLAFAPPSFSAEKASAIGTFVAPASNNWAISGKRTITGRAILASDPHRYYSIPAPRYVQHLAAPGIDVIGATDPYLPGVSIGHNREIAFALTSFPMDQADLYVYETDPAQPDRYRYGDAWETMRSRTEAIAVRGEPDRSVVLRWTRHGPVIAEEAAAHRAYAVRAAWLDPGAAPYFASLGYLRAARWNEFLDALKRWGSPSLNLIYADTAGNVGWIPAGWAPVRRGWDGLLPVPGDGRYEWSGFLGQSLLPSELNPPRGFVASANGFDLPPGYPDEQRGLAFEWVPRSRLDRIEAVLGTPGPIGLDASERLQSDHVSPSARRVLAVLRRVQMPDPTLADTAAWLSAWDAVESADSPQAALYDIWLQKHLMPALSRRLVPPEAAALIPRIDIRPALAALEQPENPRDRDALVADTLRDALDEAGRRLGPDRRRWRLEKVARIALDHPLSDLLPPVLRQAADLGDIPKSGSSDTVDAAYADPDSLRIVAGASFRTVIDVGDWDRSLVVNAPGQSGNPADPHYRDQLAAWRAGRYVPLLFTRKAVDAAAERIIRLRPVG